MNFGKGFIPDPDGHRYTSARRLIGSASPPAKASLRDWAPPILDQGQTSSCVGHALASAFATSARANGVVLPWYLPSPRWIYTMARAVDRDSPDLALVDEGSMPNQAVRAVGEFGMVANEEFPLGGGASINEEPTLQLVEKASRVHALDWRSILTGGRDMVLDMMRAIAFAKCAVPFAIEVDHGFEDYNGSGVLGPEQHGSWLGGHMLEANGYTTTSAGVIVFDVPNSWSADYGDAGYWHVNADFMIARASAVSVAAAHFRGAR